MTKSKRQSKIYRKDIIENPKNKLSEKDLVEKKIKTISENKNHSLRIQLDEVKLSNGESTYREFVRHPGASLIVPEIEPGVLLFIKQYRYPVKKTFLEFPAGKMDPGETPLATAKRELREEVGLVAKNFVKLTHIHPVIGYSDEVIHLYLAQKTTFIGAQPDEGEFLISKILTLKEALKELRNHRITDVKTQIALSWYQHFIES